MNYPVVVLKSDVRDDNDVVNFTLSFVILMKNVDLGVLPCSVLDGIA
jgi:hypothetical protein